MDRSRNGNRAKGIPRQEGMMSSDAEQTETTGGWKPGLA